MNIIQLTIPGPPAGKQRARILKTGFSYTPKKTVNYETLIKELFAIEYPDHVPWSGPVMLTVSAYFPIPKATPKKRMEEMKDDLVWCPQKNDWDNIGKIVSDALNGIAYNDDRQIVAGGVYKCYSLQPRIDICLEEL